MNNDFTLKRTTILLSLFMVECLIQRVLISWVCFSFFSQTQLSSLSASTPCTDEWMFCSWSSIIPIIINIISTIIIITFYIRIIIIILLLRIIVIIIIICCLVHYKFNNAIVIIIVTWSYTEIGKLQLALLFLMYVTNVGNHVIVKSGKLHI